MVKTADFLIVGGGVIGSSIAYHLARQGKHQVLLCEKGRPPGMGSTAMSGGLIRMHHTNPYQAKLAWSSYPYFQHWNEIVGGDCAFQKTGFFQMIGKGYQEHAKKNIRMLKKLGICIQMLSPDDFIQAQPFFSPEDIAVVAYEPDSGYADPVKATMSFLQQAQQNGLGILEGVKVHSLKTVGDRVIGIHSNVGEIEAKEVILCNNIDAKPLLQSIGLHIPLQSKKIGICFFQPSEEISPPLATCIDDTIGTYFRRTGDGKILVGISTNQLNVDPDTLSPLTMEDFHDALHLMQHRIPKLRNQTVFAGGRSSFDSYSPDKHGIVGRLQEIEGLYVATGFSGGGFKIAPALGEYIAYELMEMKDHEDLQPYRLSRFEQNRWIQPKYPYRHM
ncbi:NAD(P)/FAD-dependent oxidoreductase [Melghirimyces algeriensis]|uniref:Glycine/D-amino acid oxidase n=1 Tax=Melghirimyces algeriensis TaxID=910412 RepID=A0A521D5D7_9BACL|nr:FAD-dependent oxidoreductase [Melghirimyces algeriensis]SMO66908.1 Glycine/D-amino acid oxidase [Melghirimyces algeriensis]